VGGWEHDKIECAMVPGVRDRLGWIWEGARNSAGARWGTLDFEHVNGCAGECVTGIRANPGLKWLATCLLTP
jgi:hypothetical protein